jgi:hypothetical protein
MFIGSINEKREVREKHEFLKIKKPLSGLLKLNDCGEYRGRTDDLLHAMLKNSPKSV